MLEFIRSTGKRSALYKCSCGNTTEADIHNVKSGNTRSCGCLQKQVVKELFTTHGQTVGKKTKAYLTWLGLKSRCDNPKEENYPYYGGRGITYCERWKKFENFLEDMGNPSNENYSIDRIDNEKGYYKENCRWATKEEQANNRRNNVFYEFNGKRQTAGDWAKELGIKRATIVMRFRRGDSIEEILSPKLKEYVLYEYQGKKQTITAWAKELGMERKTLSKRLAKGIDVNTAFSTTGYLRI